MGDRLLIRLDSDKAIPKGDHRFEFPITVPETLPPFNVWQVTLCRYSTGNMASCLQPSSSEAMATFPLAGFALGSGQWSGELGNGIAESATVRYCGGLKGILAVAMAAVTS